MELTMKPHFIAVFQIVSGEYDLWYRILLLFSRSLLGSMNFDTAFYCCFQIATGPGELFLNVYTLEKNTENTYGKTKSAYTRVGDRINSIAVS